MPLSWQEMASGKSSVVLRNASGSVSILTSFMKLSRPLLFLNLRSRPVCT